VLGRGESVAARANELQAYTAALEKEREEHRQTELALEQALAQALEATSRGQPPPSLVAP
jgi:hypothetical protein